MKPVSRIGMGALSGAFVFSIAITPVWATSLGGAASEKISSMDLTLEETEDALVYARDTGVSVERAEKEMTGQEDFAVLVDEMREKYTSDFVDAEWKSSSPEIILKTGAPKTAIDLGTELADVIILDAPNEVERLKATETVHKSAQNLDGMENVVTYADISGEISVLAQIEASSKKSLRSLSNSSDVQNSLNEEVPKEFPVTVSFVTDNIGEVEIRGGRAYGNKHCTAAFSLTLAGYAAVSTAEHCSNNVTRYDGADVQKYKSLARAKGDARIVRAKTKTYKATNTFRFDNSRDRIATGASNPVNGSAICKYGITTGYNCSKVYKSGICSSGYCNLHAAEKYISKAGDSGGPWFSGSMAKGIHHGVATIDGKSRSLFTRIGVVKDMGGTVKVK